MLFEIKTIQASNFRNLIEALKDIFIEINFVVDQEGIHAISIDNTRSVLANVNLLKAKFDTFICNVDKAILGIDMMHFFKIIKTIANNEILNLLMEENDPNTLIIKIENPDSNMITTYKLKLMDLEQNNIKIPNNITFDVIASMQSNLFLKIIKDMNNFAKVVEIKSSNNELIFSCKGIITERETILKENEGGLSLTKVTNNIVQCLYLLKMLFSFTKCTHLSNVVELKLKNDFAIIVKYFVGTLGEIELILSNYKDE